MTMILVFLLQVSSCYGSSLGNPPTEQNPAFVIARTWEEAEQILGEEASTFFGGPGFSITKRYPNSQIILWQDLETGLVMARSTKKWKAKG